MKSVIIYESNHHGNTEKLVKALAEEFNIELVDAKDNKKIDFNGYDLIGLASGICWKRFYKNVESYAEKTPKGKKVFYLYTCADNSEDFSASTKEIVEKCGGISVGSFGCKGWNSWGIFKLIGGINKKHPTKKDIQKAKEFYQSIINNE